MKIGSNRLITSVYSDFRINLNKEHESPRSFCDWKFTCNTFSFMGWFLIHSGRRFCFKSNPFSTKGIFTKPAIQGFGGFFRGIVELTAPKIQQMEE